MNFFRLIPSTPAVPHAGYPPLGPGGAWLVWQGVREHRGLAFVGAGILALGGYEFVATLQPDRISAGSWPPTAGLRGRLAGLGHGRRRLPADRYDLLGAALCLAGVAVIMYAPRTS